MKKLSTRTLVAMGLLIALEIVLSRFLSFATWNVKIGFSFLPIAVAGMLFGPVNAAIVAALGDFIGAVLFPIGAYFPGFTLTAALMGASLGFFLQKKQTLPFIASAVLLNQFVFGLLLNTFWISVLYGSPFFGLLPTRAFQSLVLSVVQIVVLRAIGNTPIHLWEKV